MDCEPIFLSRAEVDGLHADSLKLFGGIAGVRDDSLVESAMGAAKNEWFYGHGDVFSVAAAYAFHLAIWKWFSEQVKAQNNKKK